jgi:hypothetical protein
LIAISAGQFILVRDNEGRTLNTLSTIAVRKAGTPIAPANAIIVSTSETMMEPPLLQRRSGSRRRTYFSAMSSPE